MPEVFIIFDEGLNGFQVSDRGALIFCCYGIVIKQGL